MDSKLTIIIIFGILFTVASIFSLVNASKLLSEGFKEIIGYDQCYYSRPKMIPEENATINYQDEYYCTNDKKRNIAESLAYLIISLPIAIFFYKKLMKIKR